MAVAVEFRASLDEHILADPQIRQAPMGSAHALGRSLGTLPHDHEQVHVAVFIRLPPSVRPEEINLFGLKFLLEPSDGIVQQSWRQHFHVPTLGLTSEIGNRRVTINSIPKNSSGGPPSRAALVLPKKDA